MFLQLDMPRNSWSIRHRKGVAQSLSRDLAIFSPQINVHLQNSEDVGADDETVDSLDTDKGQADDSLDTDASGDENSDECAPSADQQGICVFTELACVIVSWYHCTRDKATSAQSPPAAVEGCC